MIRGARSGSRRECSSTLGDESAVLMGDEGECGVGVCFAVDRNAVALYGVEGSSSRRIGVEVCAGLGELVLRAAVAAWCGCVGCFAGLTAGGAAGGDAVVCGGDATGAEAGAGM